VHIDASNFAIGVMLGQNPDNTIDRPIYCASRLMNREEKNHTTTEKEALTMIYVMKKSKHYLLGNSFIFLWIIRCITIFGEQINSNRLNCQMVFNVIRV